MQIRQLSYIVSIAECRTISKAAEKLFVSRSSLNGYLLQLEKELGTPLFYRNQKRLVPTFAGECYVAAAKNMLSIYDQMDDQLKEIKDSSAGQIKLGVNRSVGEQIFRHVFPEFHQQHPKYQIQLTVSESIE
ncbi:MAG: LysR family transcriptional regulator, partial [Clostridiales bacterium]